MTILNWRRLFFWLINSCSYSALPSNVRCETGPGGKTSHDQLTKEHYYTIRLHLNPQSPDIKIKPHGISFIFLNTFSKGTESNETKGCRTYLTDPPLPLFSFHHEAKFKFDSPGWCAECVTLTIERDQMMDQCKMKRQLHSDQKTYVYTKRWRWNLIQVCNNV